VRFEDFMAASTKMTVFWVVRVIALMIEAPSTSETSVNFYQPTQNRVIFSLIGYHLLRGCVAWD
jgi:hypothetical protein